MAARVVRDGLRAAGLDVAGSAVDWELTPKTPWVPALAASHHDSIEVLDAENVRVRIEVSCAGRSAALPCDVVVPTGLISRLHLDSRAFVMPIAPGQPVRVHAWAECLGMGGASRAQMRRTLLKGEFTAPESPADALGCAGTGVMVDAGSYMFLHAAEVDGVPCYVAVNASLRVSDD